MIAAEIERAFRAVPPGEIHPRDFAPGEVVYGATAQLALDLGCANPIEAQEAAERSKLNDSEGDVPAPGAKPKGRKA